jgi:hypothetical protein
MRCSNERSGHDRADLVRPRIFHGRVARHRILLGIFVCGALCLFGSRQTVGDFTNIVTAFSNVFFTDSGAAAFSIREPGKMVGKTNGVVVVIWQETFDLSDTNSWHDLATNTCPVDGAQTIYIYRHEPPLQAFYRAKVLIEADQ